MKMNSDWILLDVIGQCGGHDQSDVWTQELSGLWSTEAASSYFIQVTELFFC